MHFATLSFIGLAVLAGVSGFDPLTITVGSTAYVLTAAQTTAAVAGLAALAIVKEKLFIAALSRGSRRGRRSVDAEEDVKSLNLETFYRAIGEYDVADCGKLAVCQVLATPAAQHQKEERLIASLFDDLENVDPASPSAPYKFAAYIGTLGAPELCVRQYARCPVPAEELVKIVDA